MLMNYDCLQHIVTKGEKAGPVAPEPRKANR